MIFHLTVPEDEDWVLELDAAGISYLVGGLEELLHAEAGAEVVSPSMGEGGVSSFVLRRAADADSA